MTGFVPTAAIAVPDNAGMALYVGRVAQGEQSVVVMHSSDGINFGEPEDVTFSEGLPLIFDATYDGNQWRIIHASTDGQLRLATSQDGIRFSDDAPIKIDNVAHAIRAPRLINGEKMLSLFFVADRSGECDRTACPRSAVQYAETTDSEPNFPSASDVLADPHDQDPCGHCGLDVWELKDVLRPWGGCSFPSPVLAVLRPTISNGSPAEEFDAVPLALNDEIPLGTISLPMARTLGIGAASIVSTRTTLAVFGVNATGSEPVQGEVTLEVVALNDSAVTCR